MIANLFTINLPVGNLISVHKHRIYIVLCGYTICQQPEKMSSINYIEGEGTVQLNL